MSSTEILTSFKQGDLGPRVSRVETWNYNAHHSWFTVESREQEFFSYVKEGLALAERSVSSVAAAGESGGPGAIVVKAGPSVGVASHRGFEFLWLFLLF